MKRTLIVGGIRLPLDVLEGEVCFQAKKELQRLHLHAQDAVYHIYRRSVDARKRDDIRFVWSVAVTCSLTSEQLALVGGGAYHGVSLLREETLPEPTGTEKLSSPPVVVGSGPAGLFCALVLARNGYRPILIERGGNVPERQEAIERFSTARLLDPETNVQFGAGGAGTFSDGKLVSRVNDPLTSFILDTFVAFGAPEEVRISAKPHIGTDLLCEIVRHMTDEIVARGGKVCFHTRMDRILRCGDTVTGIRTSQGEIPTGALVLAIGHSARDTYEALMTDEYRLEPKPFSVGVRVEHLQSQIDAALYGRFAGHPALGHAEYHLSYDTANRGVYSFCMCPGGYVMAAASEPGGVVVNGMSYHARDGRNANSAIAVSVFPQDYGATPGGAIAFQRGIERAAFTAGGETYATPLTTMGDLLQGRGGTAPGEILPTYMNGQSYRLSTPEAYLPAFVTEALRRAMPAFDKTIHGFTTPHALLSGAETRTSAPLRILRSPDTRTAIGYRNLYPTGEGAGYAGGITSAALDGVRTAIAIMQLYRPL
jgi:hypothetical protein